MNVLFVSSGNKKNGISPIIKNQADTIRAKGVLVDQFPIIGKGIWGYIQNILKVRQQLKNKKYEIIHAHYGLCGITALFARKSESLVVSFMGDDIVGSNRLDGTVTLFSRLLCKLNVFLAKHVYDQSIVKSAEMQEITGRDKVSLVPNGVDLSRFLPVDKKTAREKLGIPLNENLLLFLSDPARIEKNYPLLIEAVNLAKDVNFTLLSLHEIKETDLVFYYCSADVAVLTSFHEGSPNVIKEALACNTPIVSTEVGDVKWLVENVSGCYISSFKPVDVAGKIKTALRFSKEFGRTNGRDKITKLGLDATLVADKILQIYFQALSPGKTNTYNN